VTADPLDPSRRALWLGPLIMAFGGGVVYLGIRGSGLAWILCLLGGLVMLAGFLRMMAGVAVLLVERRRIRILREGIPATATVTSLEEIGKVAGWTNYKWTLSLTRPDGTVKTAERRGAVPPQYGGSIEAGDELPIRLDADGETFAVDWDRL
jgi:hypothetical protein